MFQHQEKNSEQSASHLQDTHTNGGVSLSIAVPKTWKTGSTHTDALSMYLSMYNTHPYVWVHTTYDTHMHAGTWTHTHTLSLSLTLTPQQ